MVSQYKTHLTAKRMLRPCKRVIFAVVCHRDTPVVCFIQCFCERQGGPPSCRRRQVSGVRGQSAEWRRFIVGSSQHDLSSTVQKKMLADVVTSRRHQTRGGRQLVQQFYSGKVRQSWSRDESLVAVNIVSSSYHHCVYVKQFFCCCFFILIYF